MSTTRINKCNGFVTLLLFFILLLLIGKVWERHFWVRVVRYVNTRTAGMEGTDVNAALG